MLTRDENLSLREKRVVVVGCGGLGGYIIEQLARLGIGHLTVIDGDKFDESNLNRQLLSTVDNIGQSKALVARERIKKVNPDIDVVAHYVFLDAANAMDLLQNHDVICDALDNIGTRLILQKLAREFNIPMVYGAVAGWYGQVATLFPGDHIPGSIHQASLNKGIEQELGNPSFTPALVASIQVSEVVKILTGKGKVLHNRFMVIDTLEQEYEVFEL